MNLTDVRLFKDSRQVPHRGYPYTYICGRADDRCSQAGLATAQAGPGTGVTAATALLKRKHQAAAVAMWRSWVRSARQRCECAPRSTPALDHDALPRPLTDLRSSPGRLLHRRVQIRGRADHLRSRGTPAAIPTPDRAPRWAAPESRTVMTQGKIPLAARG